MAIIYYLSLIVFVGVALLLVILVLLQSDKGGGIAGNLGALGSGINNVLGATSGNFLTKLTTWTAIAFMALCIFINVISHKKLNNNTYKSRTSQAVKEMEKYEPASILPKALKNRNNLPTEGMNLPPAPPKPVPGQ